MCIKAEIINNDTASGVDCGLVVDGWYGGMVGCGWYPYLRMFAVARKINVVCAHALLCLVSDIVIKVMTSRMWLRYF